MKVEVNLTVSEMCAEICRRLRPNEEVKITSRWVRVQHTAHLDQLTTVKAIDRAFAANLVADS